MTFDMYFRGKQFRGNQANNYRRQLFYNDAIPEQVIPFGQLSHTCEDDIIVKSKKERDIPFFNAPIFTENKIRIGKVDEIFGHITNYYVSIKLADSFMASSIQDQQTVYIDPSKLLPMERVLQKNPSKSRGFKNGRSRGGICGRRSGYDRPASRRSYDHRFTNRGGYTNEGFKRGGRAGYYNNKNNRMQRQRSKQ